MKDWYNLGLTSLNKAFKEDSQLDLHSLALAIDKGEVRIYTHLPESKLNGIYCTDSNGDFVFVEKETWRASGFNNESEVLQIDEPSSKGIANHIMVSLTSEEQFSALESALPEQWISLIDSEKAGKLVALQKMWFADWPDRSRIPKDLFDHYMGRMDFPDSPGGRFFVKSSSLLHPSIGGLMVQLADLQKFDGSASSDIEPNPPKSKSTPGHGAAMAPHWGEGLRTIIHLSNRMWGPHAVDPSDEDTFPLNTEVIAEFEARGFNNRIAKELAKAIRPDWGKVVSRKKLIIE
ncbi:hypothetical protein ACJJID_13890 [Microbulbifer sp. CnH-101-G]|uniref:hypothetical protein n=1 Tax=Microbulbifer sp. CnH-101-G TaxID=3243393 RepID=UPI004039B517